MDVTVPSIQLKLSGSVSPQLLKCNFNFSIFVYYVSSLDQNCGIVFIYRKTMFSFSCNYVFVALAAKTFAGECSLEPNFPCQVSFPCHKTSRCQLWANNIFQEYSSNFYYLSVKRHAYIVRPDPFRAKIKKSGILELAII